MFRGGRGACLAQLGLVGGVRQVAHEDGLDLLRLVVADGVGPPRLREGDGQRLVAQPAESRMGRPPANAKLLPCLAGW